MKVELRTANPFHIEAVATYGAKLRTCEDLRFVRRALDELHNYLLLYPKPGARIGGAIGLRGGYGSGKTHLLTLLSKQAERMTSIKAEALYGKADSSSLFDLYRQIVGMLDRSRLIGVIDQALLRLAIEHVQRAKVTEGLKERLNVREDLHRLIAEHHLDPELLREQLRERLEAVQVPREILRAVLLVPSPTLGDRAHAWLLGGDVQDLASLGLSHQLREIGEVDRANAVPDVAAVNALEAVAALYRLAETPLLVLIDQLEVLLRAEESRQQILYSVLKKLIEQLARQHALVFLAGSDEAWQKLPQDVPARLRQREPLRVGELSLQETGALLAAYTEELPSFDEAAIRRIHELSGGSPREIIRIGYYAFEQTDGDLRRADDAVLLSSAHESGTVAERRQLALATMDRVLPGYGNVLRDFEVGDGVLVDRILEVDARPVLALVALCATDKLSEIDLARRVHRVIHVLENRLPDCALVVVAVGYSSDEVRMLLSETSIVIQFAETSFAGQLNTAVLELAGRRRAETAAGSGASAEVVTLLERISARLEQLESRRAEEQERVQRSFAGRAAMVNAAAQEGRVLQSRWQILNELDSLSAALKDGDLERERQVMNAVLVANEAYLRDPGVDDLGGLYLEALFRHSRQRGAQRVPPGPDPAAALRGDLLDAIVARVRRPAIARKILAAPVRTSLEVGATAGLVMSLKETFVLQIYDAEMIDLAWVLVMLGRSFVAAALAGLACYAAILAQPWFVRRRNRRWRQAIESL